MALEAHGTRGSHVAQVSKALQGDSRSERVTTSKYISSSLAPQRGQTLTDHRQVAWWQIQLALNSRSARSDECLSERGSYHT
jgi:hypothetical protein